MLCVRFLLFFVSPTVQAMLVSIHVEMKIFLYFLCVSNKLDKMSKTICDGDRQTFIPCNKMIFLCK